MLEEIMLIILILIIITVWVVGWIKEKKRNYKGFNEEYPVGSFFFTNIKEQKFPYGEWVYRGKNIDGYHVFIRVK